MIRSAREIYIQLLEEYEELSTSCYEGPYPPCTSIDGHGVSGFCDCNSLEYERRLKLVAEKRIELAEARKKYFMERG